MTSGVTGAFLFFFPQLVLTALAMNLCEMTWQRRMLSAILLAALSLVGLHLELAGLPVEQIHVGVILISLAWAIYPTIVFSGMNSYSPKWVERFAGFQQMWLRIFFLFWVRENAPAIEQLGLASLMDGGILASASVVALGAALFFRSGGWVLSTQTVISFFLVALLLRTGIASGDTTLVWLLLLASTSTISAIPGPFFLRRAEVAAIGGGVYLGLMALLDTGFSGNIIMASGWAALFSILGAYSWVKNFPEENKQSSGKEDCGVPSKAMTILRVAIQVGLLIPLWPHLALK